MFQAKHVPTGQTCKIMIAELDRSFCDFSGSKGLTAFSPFTWVPNKDLEVEGACEVQTDPFQAARRWDLRDGLRSSEILMMQRALNFYASFYQELAGKAVTAGEKAENMNYIAAANRLSNRLRTELVAK